MTLESQRQGKGNWPGEEVEYFILIAFSPYSLNLGKNAY